jgi:hypothetical protein
MSRPVTHMRVSGVKGHAASVDGDSVTVTFSTKYVGDFELTMPRSCVDQLIAELNAVSAGADALARKSPPSSATQHEPPVNVRVPKRWLVTADYAARGGLVLLVFDHQTDAQIGFALNPTSAKKVATGLNQEADEISARRKTPLA